MKRLTTAAATFSCFFVLVSPQIWIDYLFADEDIFAVNPQSQNSESVDEKILRLKHIKKERQGAFNDFNRENTALERESEERIKAIDADFSNEQRTAEERKIRNEIKVKKRKIFQAYKEHYDRLSKEKDDKSGVERRPASSDGGDVRTRLRAAPDYYTNVKKKRKTSGYKKRKSKKSKPTRVQPKRSQYKGSRYKGSRKGSY